eukprot:CAMPEP_0184309976 /NCGR_PEP_ID=MMETSP1049-20130417/21505_1 /TAXON_ID=77928 /ORGANISM="Proteomonas sulcata, Strain CCMP704" /LENGTH=45 /DNA_ID= /DNA_START= /DNA_END= /DNA_ORIENTATION=
MAPSLPWKISCNQFTSPAMYRQQERRTGILRVGARRALHAIIPET